MVACPHSTLLSPAPFPLCSLLCCSHSCKTGMLTLVSHTDSGANTELKPHCVALQQSVCVSSHETQTQAQISNLPVHWNPCSSVSEHFFSRRKNPILRPDGIPRSARGQPETLSSSLFVHSAPLPRAFRKLPTPLFQLKTVLPCS